MKRLLVPFLATVLLIGASCNGGQIKNNQGSKPNVLSINKARLKDKIKGGWAGQVIGCTYGGPTEFKYNGALIHDYQSIPWDEGRCKWYFENCPGLYDDIYMDLTFVGVFEKEGLDAPASSHAKAFAYAGYPLWHANQAARYNIMNGTMPPESGHWLNNPHADDIDFQIEADFAGLMSPGMVNVSSEICDKIGHIMNYGDGWYGGVFVAAMYSLAFFYDDVEYVVTEALKTIPAESQFYQCIDDVIAWWRQYPDDWKQNWFKYQTKWGSDIGCPDGVFRAFNIDAKINAAHIVIGLLYGEGDYSKTIDISTRCGDDSDCNPASAAGILGTIIGYDQIPGYWKKAIYPIEDVDFQYTSLSLNDVYELGNKHALENLTKNGASIDGDMINVAKEEIKPVALEINFAGHYPKEKIQLNTDISPENAEFSFSFNGIGFVLKGQAVKESPQAPDKTLEIGLYIDGEFSEKIKMPTARQKRKQEVAFKYQLSEGEHNIKVKLLAPEKNYAVRISDLLTYVAQ